MEVLVVVVRTDFVEEQGVCTSQHDWLGRFEEDALEVAVLLFMELACSWLPKR